MTKRVLDVETTTKNKGHPFTPENKLVSYAIKTIDNPTCVFQHVRDPTFKSGMGESLAGTTELIGFAFKFDLHWCRREFDLDLTDVKIWDCQLAEFILNNQQGAYLSLNEALKSYGLEAKDDRVKEYWDAGIDTIDIPVDVLEIYNVRDATLEEQLYHAQRAIMTEKQINLVYLLGEDMKTLLDAEAYGVKWNEYGAIKKMETLSKEVDDYTKELSTYLPDINHGIFNWDSGDHLSALLYGGTIDFDYVVSEPAVYLSGPKKGTPYIRNRWYVESITFPGFFKPLPRTEVKKTKDNKDATTRFYKVDEPTLLTLKGRNKRIIELLVGRAEKLKIFEMIESIEKKRKDLNWNDGKIHAQFNQNVVITGRLSSSNPNMQNTPLEVDELFVSEYDT